MTTINPEILTMPLSELRERVELAERLALASRLTPTASYAQNGGEHKPQITESLPTADNSASTSDPKPSRSRKNKTTEAPKEDPKETAKGTEPAGDAPSAEDFGSALDSNEPNSGELSLDDLEDADGDMMADFSLDGETTPDYRALLTDFAEKFQAECRAKNDKARLTKARDLMQKYGVQRIGDLPDDKVEEFYAEFKAL